MQVTDTIDLERLRAVLRHRIPSISFQHVEETNSTNQDLLTQSEEGAENWTVLISDTQNRGRGRHQRRWYSPLGGLYMSVLLRVEKCDSPVTLLPLVAGLTLHEALKAEASQRGGRIETRVKWPNDLMTPSGKLAGVLCESREDEDEWIVVMGLGVNIYPLPHEASRLILNPLSSLREEMDLDWSRSGVMTAFLPRLHSRIADWVDTPAVIRQDWMEASKMYGRRVKVKGTQRTLEGLVTGLSDAGGLMVQTVDGEQEITSAESIEELDG